MKGKIFYIAATALIAVMAVFGFMTAPNRSGGKAGSAEHEPAKEDMITVYTDGREIRILPDSPRFAELKGRIEVFAANIDDMYRMMYSESKVDEVKRAGKAIELKYVSPKETATKISAGKLKVTRIFIPLAGGGLPPASILLQEENSDAPRIYANTAQSKEDLLTLVKTVE